MALFDHDTEALFRRLERKHREQSKPFTRLDRYYEGEQRLDRIGIAVPPELAMFKASVNVPRMAVDEVVNRQTLRGFQRSGKSGIDAGLREAWENNNLDSQSLLLHQDCRLFGRAFASVSTNHDDAKRPLIKVESPEGLVAEVNDGVMTGALRIYRDEATLVRHATLYLPGGTFWLKRDTLGWEMAREPDVHELGRVPIVMFLNRHRTGRWSGVSEMADVIEKTDAVARLISNMQVGGEAMAWPKRWVAGMSKDDFVDEKGQPIPVWESYLTAIAATQNENAKFGEFAAADLANFHKAVNALLAWCAAELGLPLRFMGQEAVNPASEGAIRADEARLIRNVERKNTSDGDSWAWVMGLYERFRLGRFGRGNPIRALWQDPSTPTRSQMADAALKLYQAGIMSREGTWDEMGWDEARKDRERSYLAKEATEDPLVAALGKPLVTDAAASNI